MIIFAYSMVAYFIFGLVQLLSIKVWRFFNPMNIIIPVLVGIALNIIIN